MKIVRFKKLSFFLLVYICQEIITGVTLAMERKMCSYKILQIAGTPNSILDNQQGSSK